jgi:hypothetical protein
MHFKLRDVILKDLVKWVLYCRQTYEIKIFLLIIDYKTNQSIKKNVYNNVEVYMLHKL